MEQTGISEHLTYNALIACARSLYETAAAHGLVGSTCSCFRVADNSEPTQKLMNQRYSAERLVEARSRASLSLPHYRFSKLKPPQNGAFTLGATVLYNSA
jgi:hypothetical protein